MIKKVFFGFLFILFTCHISLFAQTTIDKSPIENDTSFVVISAIKITGNKKTKSFIIRREMQIIEGDKIAKNKIAEILKQARTQVYNTNLFIEVKIDSTVLMDASLQLNVVVKERWYIYPTPQFQLVDRSFNEWVKTFNADFNRVVYGINFTNYNISGRRDKLSITLLNGYSRNISFSYNNPYSNPKLTEGFSVFSNYSQNREINNSTTFNHRILAYKGTGFVRNNFSFGGSYSIRKGFFKRTSFSLGFNYTNIVNSVSNTIKIFDPAGNYVKDSIVVTKLNPVYFNTGKNQQFFTDFGLGVFYANTDKNAYPLKGKIYSYGITKRGLGLSGGINVTTFFAGYSKFLTHPRNFYSAIKVSGTLKLPFKQAYINQRAIGYGALKLRGLELKVIDGVAASVLNYTFSKKLVSFKIPVPFKIKAVPYIPMNIFAKTYTDIGYSYLPQPYNGRLNNKFIYTGGFGIDILSLYDIVIKLEYSFNQLGEKGLFLQGGANF